MGIVILLQAQLVYSGTVRFARPGCTSTGWHTRTGHGTGSYSWQCHGMQLSYTRNPAWLWERRALPYSESMRCDFPFAFPSWFPHSLWMFSGWRDAYKCGNRFGTGVHPLWHPPVSELQQGCRIRNLFRHKIYAKKTTHGVAVIYGVLCPFVGQVEPCLHQIHPQHRLDTPNRSPMRSLRIVRSDHFYPCFPRDDLFHC